MGTNAGDAKGWLLGDGLVPVKSALGIHWDPKRNVGLSPSRQSVGYAMLHPELLHRPDVYAKLQESLAS